jgi:hypothetical protein
LNIAYVSCILHAIILGNLKCKIHSIEVPFYISYIKIVIGCLHSKFYIVFRIKKIVKVVF